MRQDKSFSVLNLDHSLLWHLVAAGSVLLVTGGAFVLALRILKLG